MVYAKIRGMILDGLLKLAKTTTKAIEIQAQVDDDYVDDGIPLLQMQGVRFKPPADAELVMVCINGDPARPVGIMAVHRDTCPTDDLEDGEGGLYYGGAFRVFVNESGEVHLGEKVADDFVALAQKVHDELNAVKSAFDSHIHTTTATVGTGSAGVISPPNSPMPSPSSVAATKVRAT